MKRLLVVLALGAALGAATSKNSQKISTDQLMAMSAIKEYSDVEDTLLEQIRKDPARVKAQLIRMHEKRLNKLLESYHENHEELLRLYARHDDEAFQNPSAIQSQISEATDILIMTIKKLRRVPV